jgi:hypothetical protein
MKKTYKQLQKNLENLRNTTNVDLYLHSENGVYVFHPKSQSRNYVYGLSISEAYAWLNGFSVGLVLSIVSR